MRTFKKRVRLTLDVLGLASMINLYLSKEDLLSSLAVLKTWSRLCYGKKDYMIAFSKYFIHTVA